MSTEPLIVSENYLWDEATIEFIHRITRQHYPATHYENKINVYEDRVREWFLNVAGVQVAKGESATDYVALSIALAYIEGVEQYRQGSKTPKGLAGHWFKTSAMRVFPSTYEDAINRLWVEARCGLFHSGFTDGPIYLSHGYDQALAIVAGKLQINPYLFVQAVIDDFNNYLNELRLSANSKIRDNFLQLWDLRWENS